MSDKSIIWLGAGVGSTIGSLLPELWGAGFLSLWSVLLSAVGGLLGIWAAWRILHN